MNILITGGTGFIGSALALYKYLRHQHKKYRKRYGKNDYRGRIPNRIDIDERPSIVDARTRIGKDLKWGLIPQAFPRSIIH
jgi:IS30 family transposase